MCGWRRRFRHSWVCFHWKYLEANGVNLCPTDNVNQGGGNHKLLFSEVRQQHNCAIQFNTRKQCNVLHAIISAHWTCQRFVASNFQVTASWSWTPGTVLPSLLFPSQQNWFACLNWNMFLHRTPFLTQPSNHSGEASWRLHFLVWAGWGMWTPWSPLEFQR